jgi:transcription antitermination factor NusG
MYHYALRVATGKERVIFEKLQKFMADLPTITSIEVIENEFKVVLMKGFIILTASAPVIPSIELAIIKSIYGIIGFHPQNVVPMSKEDYQNILKVELVADDSLRKGDIVEVINGALIGTLGTIIEIRGPFLMLVKFNLGPITTEVELNINVLRKIKV